jgi:AraC-like DNA-binding protein
VSADLLIGKDHWIRTKFQTFNFSLVLRGDGTYRRRERSWRVAAPCVITQWPGEWIEYGPDKTWDEMYFVYHKRSLAALRAARLVDPSRPVWPIVDPASVGIHLAEFSTLARNCEPEAVVDRADRIAERIVLETWAEPPATVIDVSPVHEAAAAMRADLVSPPDPGEWAVRHGYSKTTFRRRWLAAFGVPPARYLRQLRISEARRLVAESMLSIREIAAACGFEDEFYFSRRFRRETGLAPRDYRKTFRLERRK